MKSATIPYRLYVNKRYNDGTKIVSSPFLYPREEIIKKFENDEYNNVDKYGENNIHGIIGYCIANNDEEFLDKIMDKYKDCKFWDRCERYENDIALANNNIIDKLFKIDGFIPVNMYDLTNIAICKNNIYLLNKLQDSGCVLNNDNLIVAFLNASVECLGTIILQFENLQNVFDKIFDVEYMIDTLTIEKIKYFMSVGIDVYKHLNIIMFNSIDYGDDNDFVIFIHKLGATNVNKALTMVCRYNNVTLLKYFLQNGATLNIDDKNNFYRPTYEVIKTLLDFGYNFSDELVLYIFEMVLKHRGIDDVEKYLINLTISIWILYLKLRRKMLIMKRLQIIIMILHQYWNI